MVLFYNVFSYSFIDFHLRKREKKEGRNKIMNIKLVAREVGDLGGAGRQNNQNIV